MRPFVYQLASRLADTDSGLSRNRHFTLFSTPAGASALRLHRRLKSISDDLGRHPKSARLSLSPQEQGVELRLEIPPLRLIRTSQLSLDELEILLQHEGPLPQILRPLLAKHPHLRPKTKNKNLENQAESRISLHPSSAPLVPAEGPSSQTKRHNPHEDGQQTAEIQHPSPDKAQGLPAPAQRPFEAQQYRPKDAQDPSEDQQDAQDPSEEQQDVQHPSEDQQDAQDPSEDQQAQHPSENHQDAPQSHRQKRARPGPMR